MCIAEDYRDILSQSEFDITAAYARRLGIREWDLPDAVQEVAVALLTFRYDPARGRNERTARVAVIRHVLHKAVRARVRYGRLVEGYATVEHDAATREDDGPDREALHGAMAELDERDRQVCAGLAEGLTVNQVAGQLGLNWRTIERSVARIRDRFTQLGLAPAGRGLTA